MNLKSILLALIVLSCNLSGAQTFTNGTGGAIPDAGAEVCFPVTVSGVGTINSSYGLEKICLNINHSYDGDLVIRLKAPDGTVIVLCNERGSSGDNFTNTCFTNAASIPIASGSASAPFTGLYLPEGKLASFNNGQNANGVWNLCIQDNYFGDVGSLLNFSLTFSNTPAVNPPPPAGMPVCNGNAAPGNTCAQATSVCNFNGFCGNTSSAYTPNSWTELTNAFNACNGAVINNNSFVKFVASASTATFKVWVYNSQTGDGIQMLFFSGNCGSGPVTTYGCNSQILPSNTSTTVTASGLTPGNTYYLMIDGWGGDVCDYTIAASTGANILTITPTAASICQGQSVTLTVSGGNGTYSWSPATGLNTTSGATVIATPAATTTYTVTSTSVGGCSSTKSVTVTVTNSPNLGSDKTISICPGQSVDLTAQYNTAGLTTSWTKGGTAVANPSNVTTAGAYQLVVTNGANCTDTAIVTVISNTATASTTAKAICSNQLPFIWNGNSYSTTGSYNVTLVNSQGCDSVATLNLTVKNTTTSTTNKSVCSNQLPFIWNGSNYNTTGTYKDTLINSQGCDSIATLNLTVKTVTTSATNRSVCSNQLPFIWNGNSYSTTGSYNVTLVNSQGCDSVATLNLTVKNTTTSTTNKSVCSNQLPFIWNGNNYNTTGTYKDTFVNSQGCDSIATLNLTVKTVTTSTTNKSVCSNQLPFIWNGSNYNTTGTYKDTFVNSQGCDSIATLNLTVKTVTTSTTNKSVCSNQLPFPWNGNNYNTTGTYKDTLINSQGCDSIATLNLTVKTVTTSTTNRSVCSNQLPFPWNGNNYSISGTYKDTFVNSQGCDSIATLNLTVKTVTTSTTNKSVCSNQLPFIWNGNNYNVTGTYKDTFVNSQGCDSIATLNLIVKTVTTSITNKSVCSNQLPFNWNGNNYNTTGTYKDTLINSQSCDSIATLNLTVKTVTTSSTNKSVCSNQLPFTWNGNNYNTTGIYKDTFVNSQGCDSIATLNLTVKTVTTSTTNKSVCSNQTPFNWNGNNYSTTGTYKDTLINSQGCDSIATLNLTVKTVTTSTTNKSVCSNQTPFNWNGNNYSTTGTYKDTLINSQGCDSIATLNLTVKTVTTSTTNRSVCSNQLPFPWNGNNYNTTGVYKDTFVNSQGCDSIATLNLTVKTVTTSTTNRSVCSNQLPFIWNGNNYNTTGTYKDTFVNSQGCDSIATLNLTVKQTSTSITNRSVCSNQLPFLWNGINYNTTGVYKDTFINSQGCDSIATLNLTVKIVTTSITNRSVCSNQLPFIWNGNNYNTTGTYKDTFVNSQGCDSIVILNLTVKQTSTSTTNRSVCSNQLPFIWNGNNYNTTGTYKDTFVNSQGCDSIATLNLTVKTVTTSTTNRSVCSNQLPFIWNGNNYNTTGTYKDTFVNSQGCDSIATLNLTVKTVTTSTTIKSVCSNQLPFIWNGNNYNITGTYKDTFVNSQGCDSIATLNLTVKTVTSSRTNSSVCSNQLPFIWNGNNYNITGIYKDTFVNNQGCDSIATLNLTVKTVTTSITNQSVCSNQLPFIWNGNNYNSTGVYKDTFVNNQGCDSIATLNLTVKPVTTSTTDQSVCSNQLPFIWNGNNYNSTGTYKDTFVNSQGCDSIATLNLTVKTVTTSTTNKSVCSNQLPFIWNGNNYNTTGTYKDTLINSQGCDSIATLNLTVKTETTSTTTRSICSNQLPFIWNGNNYNTTGIYKDTFINSQGCDSIATLNLTVKTVTTSTTNRSVCSNQLPFIWNGNNYNITGTYKDTFVNSQGCDSIATLSLTVKTVTTSTINRSVCSNQLPFIWNGNNYNSTGVYKDTFVNSQGCDSIATLNLIVKTVTTSTTNRSVCSNQLPFIWNGNNYNTTGTYKDTFVNSQGCDSIATLNLTVKTVTTSTMVKSVCSNQLPFIWNGNNYNTTGTYKDTFVNSQGCDSIATLNLTVKTVTASTTLKSVCSNQLPFSWNGNNYNTTGTYKDTLINSQGCDSIATLNLTVKAVTTSTTNRSVCSNQLPFIWNGNNYNTTGIYKDTFVNSQGCDSIVTLNLTVKTVTTSTTNRSVCSNQLPFIWNGNNYNTTGIYKDTFVNSQGCDSIATLNLTVKTVTTSTTNRSVCSNQLPFIWNGNNYNTTGTYKDTLLNSQGCDSIATLNLTVKTVTTSTTNQSVCSNQLPFRWNGNNYSTTGIYKDTLVNSQGCDSIATLNLTVKTVTTSTTIKSVCSNQLPFIWNGNNYSTTGTYKDTLLNSQGCDSIATLNLTIIPFIKTTINAVICQGSSYTFPSGTVVSSAGTYNDTIKYSSGCDSLITTVYLTMRPLLTNTINASICSGSTYTMPSGNTVASSGTYPDTIKYAAGCDSLITTVNLNVINPGKTDFTMVQDVCNPKSIKYISADPVVANSWTFKNNSIITATSPVISYANYGNYTVKLYSIIGACRDSVIKVIPVSLNQSDVILTHDTAICAGNSLKIQTDSGIAFCWKPDPTISNPAVANTTVTPSSTKTYYFNSKILGNNLLVNGDFSSGNTGFLTGLTYSFPNINGAGEYWIGNNPVLFNPQFSACTDHSTGSGNMFIANGPVTPGTIIWSQVVPVTPNTNYAFSAWLQSLYASNPANLKLLINGQSVATNITAGAATCTWKRFGVEWNSGNAASAVLSIVNASVDTIGNDLAIDDITFAPVAVKYDSIKVTVKPVFTKTVAATVCAGNSYVLPSGTIVTTPGLYSDTVFYKSGCDSLITTVNLTSQSAVVNTSDVAICTGQTYTLPWGVTVSTAGSYKDTMRYTSGCDSVIKIVNVTLKSVTTSTTNKSVCSNQLPFVWNGNNYTTSGSYTVTLMNSQGCDSVATLMLNINDTLTSTTNTAICNNQLPYTWNGNNYNAAGTYNVTLKSVANCDSIATLVLTVNSILTSTTNKSVCSNQLPYNWNGNNYNAAGTYSVTLKSVANCDSVATLVLAVNSVLTSTTNKAVCSNQLPYNWNGNNYAAAGTYNVTLKSVANCDSIATLVLAVNSVLTTTTNKTICSNQLPYTWNGNNYNAAGTYNVTLKSVANCDSIATLVLAVNSVLTSTTNKSICSNQLPYNWNGNNYNAAGTYNVTLKSVANCDSIATLVLTVNSILTSTTNKSICSNQLPYNWNGNNYNAAGTYNVTLKSVANCDSIATLVLTVNSVLTSTTNKAICSNQLPYNWNGNNYNAAGTYNVTLKSVANCDSIATLVLTVNSVLTSTTNKAVCSNQLPFNWNGNNYNAAGTYSVTLKSVANCDSIATLVLTVNSILTSTTNKSICSNQLPYNWNGNNYNAAGTYSVTLKSVANCDSIATLVLAVNSVLTSATNKAVCSNQLPYNWNGNNYNAAGTYNVTLKSVANCDSIATLVLTVNSVLTSTTNKSVCSNQLPYNWNGNNYNTAGTYNVTLKSVANCDSIATLVLTVNSVLTSTTNKVVCSNQLPYYWNGNNYNTAGTYNVTLKSVANCDSIATLILTVNPVKTSTINKVICSNQLPYNWNGNNYNAAGTYNVTLQSAAGCDSIATLVLTLNSVLTSTTNKAICSNQLPFNWNGNNYNAAGTYSVTLKSVANCDSIATLVLTVNSVLTSTTNKAVCSNQLPYNWNGNNYNSAGTYNVTLKSVANCDSIAALVLTVNSVLTSTTNKAICSNQLPYNWNGNNYNAAGTYNVTLKSVANCDSVATLVLNVNNTLTTTTNKSICSNQLPFNWNGNNYNAAGTYNVTLQSVANCDSIATLVLTVNSVLTSTTNKAVCSNQLPYNWNGTNYNAAGTYNVTLKSVANCDSIATLVLTVNSILTSTTNKAVCSNQLPYYWNGNNYNAAGTYNVTLKSVANCDSIATLILTVNPVKTSTTNKVICSNQLPYNWNGNNYNAAGTYTVKLISAAGCDSNATLILTVNPVRASTTNKTICSNQLPYNWNNNSYTTAGTYKVTLASAAGCDSVASLILTVNPVKTSTTNKTICINQLPYSWNGNSYNAGGTYNVTLQSAAGCDSIATLLLAVNSVLKSTTNKTLCSNQLPYNWNGNSYNAAGTYNVTLKSVANCDSIAALILTVNPVKTSTTNKVICSNQLPYNWNGNNYNAAGTYTVKLISAAGCDSNATLILTVNPVRASTTNKTICSNQLPYNWNNNSYTTAGTYKVTLISAAGCDSVASLILTVNPVRTSTTNKTICINQLPYNWNGNTYNAAGTYNVTLTASSGCDSIATLVLTVNAVLTSTTRKNVCNNQLPFIWNGNSYNSSGIYNIQLTGSSGCDSIATLILSVTQTSTSTTSVSICSLQLPYNWNGNVYNASGTYTVTKTNAAGCDSVATLYLTVKPTPSAPLATNNSPLCAGEDIALSAAAIPGTSCNWYGPAGFSSSLSNPVIKNCVYANTGTYSVTATADGCTSAKSFTSVNVKLAPVVNAGRDKDAYEGDTVTISPFISMADVSYKWTPSTYFISSDEIKNPAVLAVNTTTYHITATTKEGCAATDDITIKVLPRLKPINVPNAFSPNGDGINDTWIIRELAAYPAATVEVFTRYGTQVFSSIGYRKPWDGTINGKPLGEGTYYYIIKPKPDSTPLSGWVAILK